MTGLHLTFLGGFQVTLDNEPVRDFVSDKARALLCYLAIEGREHRRNELATLLWGEMPESKARVNLRQVLSNLRRLVGDHLVITRHTAAFDRQSVYRLDVDEFAAAVAEFRHDPDPRTGQRAADVYQGDLGRGFLVRDAPAFEEWLAVQREWLHTAAVEVFYGLAAHDGKRGAYRAALRWLDRLLALEPWREEAHRQRMLFLARLGRHGAALKQYQTCRRLLADELSVAPSAETRVLYERIRRAQSRSRPEASRLPPQPTSFVGRESELARLGAWLADPDERLITLLGPGGVGKTRLALEAAQRDRFLFLDGIYFLSLTSLPSADLLPQALAEALDLSPAGDAQPAVLDHLRDREALLVLDNFEHLLCPSPGESARLLSSILAATPRVKMLVTSREPLCLRWERRFSLDGLSYPQAAEVSDDPTGLAESYDAVSLFLQQARRLAPGFAPAPQDWKAVAHICRLVEGLPLAVELAAALTPDLSCPDLAGRLQQSLDVLASPWRDVPTRHRSLRAVFDHSWDLLSETEQQALRDLSVFRGGFSLAAAGQVVGASRATLNALAAKSLLLRVSSERYDLHETLRQYAAEQLDLVPAARDALEQAHARYFVDFVRDREQAVTRSGRGVAAQRAARREIGREMENIRTAWRRIVALGDVAALGRMAGGLGAFYELASGYPEAKALFDRAIEALRNRPDRAQADEVLGLLLRWQGVYALNLGRYEEAGRSLEASARAFRLTNDHDSLAWVVLSQGRVAGRAGDIARAEACYRESLALFEELGGASGVAVCLEFLGTAAAIRGDFSRARSHYRQSLERYQSAADLYGSIGALYCLGDVARITGEYSQARAHFSECLEKYRALQNLRGEAQALNQLGNVCRLSGEPVQAQIYHEESLVLRREIGERDGIAASLTNLGLDLCAQGEKIRAREYCLQGLSLFRQTKRRRGIVFALIQLGHVQRALGEHAEARDTLLKALREAEDIRDRPLALEAIGEAAVLLADLGKGEAAQSLALIPLEEPAAHHAVRERARRLCDAVPRQAGDLQLKDLVAQAEHALRDCIGSGPLCRPRG